VKDWIRAVAGFLSFSLAMSTHEVRGEPQSEDALETIDEAAIGAKLSNPVSDV
jgi:hypothetical protein